jgi:hypothetical protein
VNRRLTAPLALVLSTSLALGGCYSSTFVPAAGLAPLRVGGRGEGGVVRAENGETVKVDPNSEIRFQRLDGTFSPWLTVRDLSVSDDGVFMLRHDDPDDLHAARVTGLSPEDIARFEHTKPTMAEILTDGRDAIEIYDDGLSLVHWMKALEEDGELPGTWTFHQLPDVGPFTGEALQAAKKHGVRVIDGLRWDAIGSAEVRNLNHGETAVAVVAITALVIGVVALASASKGKINIPMPNLGGVGRVSGAVVRGVVRGTRVVARAASNVRVSGSSGSGSGSGGSCCNATPPTTTSEPVPAGATGEISNAKVVEPPGSGETATLGAPWLEPPSADGARPLFDGMARRQSIVRVVGSFDGERDLSDAARTHLGLAAVVRLYNFVELGGGLRWLGTIPSADGTGGHRDLIPFARFGIHAELDAHRRFAFPFAIDMGGGGDVAFYTKLVFGLRVRVTEAWSLGLYAFNPTLVAYKEKSGLADRAKWSFPSGLEMTFAF